VNAARTKRAARTTSIVAGLRAAVLPGLLLLASWTSALAASPPRVAVLLVDKPESAAVFVDWLREGLADLGYRDGETVLLDVRWGHGDDRRLPALARTLLAQKPRLIVTACGPAQRAIRDLDRTIPIVALCAEWANYLGEVASLSHPGGATTGFLMLAGESAGKRLQWLKQLKPDLSRVAVLHNRVDDWTRYWDATRQAARALGITLLALPPVERAEEIDGSLARAVDGKAEALVVFPDATTTGAAERIAAFAIRHRLMTAFDQSTFVQAGGLLAYGPDWREVGQRVLPRYVDRILKGASPAGLPIEQPTKFTLDINLRTAKAIGLIVSREMLMQVDRVIE
jgi:putative ABC transport system substrate-binding protein